MNKRPFKVAVTGTHSTGKSEFLDQLKIRLEASGKTVVRVANLAVAARAAGFPILRDHTIDSTLWIMAECIRQEAEASLIADVILVDRPVSDALGYLEAALEVSGRSIDAKRFATVKMLAASYVSEYDVLVETVLAPEITMGADRDKDVELRLAAARCISRFADEAAEARLRLSPTNQQILVQQVLEAIGF